MTQHAKECDSSYVNEHMGYAATVHHQMVMCSIPQFRKAGISSILDVGCGRGVLLGHLLASKFEVSGTEICQSLLEGELKNRGLPVFPYSIDQLRVFDDSGFDLVLGVDLIGSLRDEIEVARFFSHARRISKKGLMITVSDIHLDAITRERIRILSDSGDHIFKYDRASRIHSFLFVWWGA